MMNMKISTLSIFLLLAVASQATDIIVAETQDEVSNYLNSHNMGVTALLFYDTENTNGDVVSEIINESDSQSEVTLYVQQIADEVTTLAVDVFKPEFRNIGQLYQVEGYPYLMLFSDGDVAIREVPNKSTV